MWNALRNGQSENRNARGTANASTAPWTVNTMDFSIMVALNPNNQQKTSTEPLKRQMWNVSGRQPFAAVVQTYF